MLCVFRTEYIHAVTDIIMYDSTRSIMDNALDCLP
jgi:hypothetical protein